LYIWRDSVDFHFGFPQDISSSTTDSVQLRVRPSFFLAGWFMTHQLGVARGRDISARWCALAERRLEYLAELFETGRWRRFHSEDAFIENIEEAKAAVRTWRELSSHDSNAIDKSWLGRAGMAVMQRGTPLNSWRDPVQLPWPANIAVETREEIPGRPPERLSEKLPGILTAPENGLERSTGESVQNNLNVPILDLAAMIAQRYPLLRNRL